MIIIDLGNTNIVIGFFYNEKLKKIIRFNTKKFKYNLVFLKIKKILDHNKLLDKSKKIILGSVVPKKNLEIRKLAKKLSYKIIIIKNKKINVDFSHSLKAINEFGIDRISNAFAANKFYGKNLIIIDFGTATTFDIVHNGIYEGGIISPGIEVSNNALAQSAAKINSIKIIKTKKIIGKNTLMAIQSGFYWGYLSLINGIIDKIVNEKKFNPNIILTGGMANIFSNGILINKKKQKVIIDQKLTLVGLYHIGKSYE